MTQGTKRLLALLLALIFCVALFPAAALAEDAGTIAPAEEPEEGAGTIAPATEPGEDPEALPREDGTEAVLASGQCGDSVYWSLSTDYAMTITGSGYMWDYEGDNHGVGDTPWKDYIEQIRSLTVEEGVTGIGKYAFGRCTSLTKVSLPEGLKQIGSWSLWKGAYTEIQFPSTLYYIDVSALQSSSLRSVTIPASVNVICADAFAYCRSLSSIYFLGSAPSISNDVFTEVTATVYYPGNDASWTEDKLQDYGGTITWVPYEKLSGACGDNAYYELNTLTGVMTITGSGHMWNYEYDFANGRGDTPWAEYLDQITTLVVSEGVIGIGNEAFDPCPNLKKISLPSTLTRIGGYAFEGCGFRYIELPDSLQKIQTGAFTDCTELYTVTFPASVTEIGDEAFSGCTGLQYIEFRGSAPSIGTDAFGDVDAAAYYPHYKAGWTEEVLQDYGGSLTWIPMESGQCGDDVYWELYPAGGELYITGSGDTWDFDGVSSYPGWHRDRETIREVYILDGVTGIGDNLFYTCTALEWIYIPGTVVSIGECAFEKCTALEVIEIPYGVQDVQRYAFENCTALKAVMFPNSLTHIGIRAFRNCGALEKLYFKCTPPEIGGQAFSGVTATAYYYSDDAAWTEDACQSYGGNLTWTPAWTMYRCGPRVFWAAEMDGHVDFTGVGKTDDWSSCPWGENSDMVRSVTVGEGVTTIGAYLFDHCSNLTQVSLPTTLTGIGKDAFYDTGITEIELPDGLKTIGVWAFACCGITEITLPEGLETIGNGAFGGTALKAIRIPASVREIGARCFDGCFYLKEIRFEGGAPEIGKAAFWNVTALAYYPADDETWTEEVRQDYDGDLTWIPCRNGKPVNPFSDVPEGQYFYKPVLWAYYHNPKITGGTSATTFGPDATCTREQIVTFLWKANGAPEPTSTDNPFADVPASAYYYKAVLWAVENKVTKGVDATHFGVGSPCTREQAMTFLWKAAGAPEPTTTDNPFTDVKTGDYYCKAVLWAVENKVTKGVDATHFGVGRPCTRGQIVTFLYKSAQT